MADSDAGRMSTDALMEDDKGPFLRRDTYSSPPSVARRTWQDYLMVSMGLLILALCSFIVYQQSAVPMCKIPSDDAGLRRSRLDPAIDERYTSEVRFVSRYSAKDTKGMAAVDAAWDAIEPTLGTVALDKQFAASLGLPAGDTLVADPSKDVYVLEAYHSVHCLKVVRETMFQLARGEKLTVPFGHSTHCLAGVLQHVVCSADDTLLFWKDGVSTGDGQARTCRNWGALKDWARNNSACFYVDDLATQHEDLTGTRCPKNDGLVLGDI